MFSLCVEEIESILASSVASVHHSSNFLLPLLKKKKNESKLLLLLSSYSLSLFHTLQDLKKKKIHKNVKLVNQCCSLCARIDFYLFSKQKLQQGGDSWSTARHCRDCSVPPPQFWLVACLDLWFLCMHHVSIWRMHVANRTALNRKCLESERQRDSDPPVKAKENTSNALLTRYQRN